MDVKVGLSVILIDRQDRVLVGKRKGSHGAGLLALPGGHLEFGESCEDCCRRELFEETGLKIMGPYHKVDHSEDIFEHNGLKKHYITLYFVGERVDSDLLEVKNLEPEKCEGWNWVPVKDLPADMFCDSDLYIRLAMFQMRY
jgi:8-oxo-dGTP diphosphatase